MRIILVFIGGGIGAFLRYLITTLTPQMNHPQLVEFPLGTLLANLIASFILGALIGIDFLKSIPAESKLLVGTGICGGLSTYSTFALESMNLLREKYYFLFFLNIILNNILTISFAVIGFLSGKIIWSKL